MGDDLDSLLKKAGTQGWDFAELRERVSRLLWIKLPKPSHYEQHRDAVVATIVTGFPAEAQRLINTKPSKLKTDKERAARIQAMSKLAYIENSIKTATYGDFNRTVQKEPQQKPKAAEEPNGY